MTRLIANQEFRSQLLGLNGYAAICDDSGQLLGYFMPNAPDEDLDNPPSLEELEEAEKSPGRPLADILRDLERLA